MATIIIKFFDMYFISFVREPHSYNHHYRIAIENDLIEQHPLIWLAEQRKFYDEHWKALEEDVQKNQSYSTIHPPAKVRLIAWQEVDWQEYSMLKIRINTITEGKSLFY
jgi:hypothetical protein